MTKRVDITPDVNPPEDAATDHGSADEESAIPAALRATNVGQTLPSLNVSELQHYLQKSRQGEGQSSGKVQLANTPPAPHRLEGGSGFEKASGGVPGDVTPREPLLDAQAVPLEQAKGARSSVSPRSAQAGAIAGAANPQNRQVPAGQATPGSSGPPPPRGSTTAPLRSVAPPTSVIDPEQLSGIRQLVGIHRAAAGLPPLRTGQANASEALAIPSVPPKPEGDASVATVPSSGLPAVHVPWTPGPELEQLAAYLFKQDLSPTRETFLSPSIGNPFEGMMNDTLELKLSVGVIDKGSDRLPSPTAELDLVWLGPGDPPPPRLPNSYGLTDEQVGLAFQALFFPGTSGMPSPQAPQGHEGAKESGTKEATAREHLIAIGLMGRLEARMIDGFARLGQIWRDVVQRSQQSQGAALAAFLEPTGLLSEPEVARALQLWVQQKHDARFFAEDDGSGQKPARLVGYQLARKKMEVLRKLKLPPGLDEPILVRLSRQVEVLGALLQERQTLLRQHFVNRTQAFNSGFLTQRGLNARPGFFWTDYVREDL